MKVCRPPRRRISSPAGSGPRASTTAGRSPCSRPASCARATSRAWRGPFLTPALHRRLGGQSRLRRDPQGGLAGVVRKCLQGGVSRPAITREVFRLGAVHPSSERCRLGRPSSLPGGGERYRGDGRLELPPDALLAEAFPRGIGPTAWPKAAAVNCPDYLLTQGSRVLGRPILGMWVEDSAPTTSPATGGGDPCFRSGRADEDIPPVGRPFGPMKAT